MGNFRRDLALSQAAVDVVMNHLEDRGYEVSELNGREAQKLGDVVASKDGHSHSVEVKYDIRARRSGNLCFEMSNGTKLTGIMTTPAAKVYYVVPQRKGHKVFVFQTEKLRAWIQNPENVVIKNGGDKKKFVLAIAKIAHVTESGIADEIFEVD